MLKLPDLPACVIPGCDDPGAYGFLGLTEDGRAFRLTHADGKRIRSCPGHLLHVIQKLDSLPGCPARIRAVPLFAPIVP